MAGGVLHPETVDKTDAELIEEATRILRRYTGVSCEPRFHHVSRAQNAIPQFNKGHTARLRAIRDTAARYPGLRLIGNSYDEVSVVGQLKRPADRTQSEEA